MYLNLKIYAQWQQVLLLLVSLAVAGSVGLTKGALAAIHTTSG